MKETMEQYVFSYISSIQFDPLYTESNVTNEIPNHKLQHTNQCLTVDE